MTLILGGLAFVFIQNSMRLSEDYHNEISQLLNRNVAKYIVEEVKGLYDGKEVDGEKVGVLMHHVMATNPSTEVYLLDMEGNILKHVAMDKVVKAERVDLAPVENFLAAEGEIYIKGDDPKEIGGKKIFSAAPYMHDGKQVGYIYTIVGGRDYDAVVAANKGSYIRDLSIKTIRNSALVALGLGLLSLFLLTRNFNKLCTAFRKFGDGDLTARVQGIKGNNELAEIAVTYNQMADTIQQNIEELKGVEKLRKELIANISHDLRTPIASIQGFAETLLMKDDTLAKEDRTRYLEIIMKSSDTLKKLVNDLFELSKLESNQRKLQAEPVQLAELMQDVADKYRLIAQEKGISINTVYSKNLPMVEADLALIDRALQNIIDNAIKFCKEGDVITLELAENNQGISTIIRDTGEGIDAKELPFIFDRYRQGKILSDSQKGSGLGLAIVKKIMELHKTDVTVDSIKNQGTTFEFSLPFQLAI